MTDIATSNRSLPWRAALVTYSLVMLATCINDRFNHRQFAFSSFCKNPDQAGVFGHVHCAEHRKEWEDLSLWLYNLFWLILPSPSPEIKLVLAHAGLSLVGWFNWVLVIGIFSVVTVAVGKAYLWYNTPPNYCHKKAC